MSQEVPMKPCNGIRESEDVGKEKCPQQPRIVSISCNAASLPIGREDRDLNTLPTNQG